MVTMLAVVGVRATEEMRDVLDQQLAATDFTQDGAERSALPGDSDLEALRLTEIQPHRPDRPYSSVTATGWA